MAGVRDGQLTKAGPWPLGVDNTSQEGALAADDFGRTIALREAVNVDLSAGGRPRRREGYLPVLSGTLVHSLWSDERLDFALVVDDGALVAVRPDESAFALGAYLGNRPVSYALVNDRVYCCNRAQACVVDSGLQAWSWAPEQPAGQPTLTAVAGALAPGQYQVAVTFTDALGRESGSTVAAVIELTSPGGILVTDIPSPVQGTVNLYCSGPNDSVLRLYDSAPAWPGGTMVLGDAVGRPLTTQHLAPMPFGDIVRFGHGRLWVARGHELFWSEPLRFGLYRPSQNRMRFNAPIDLLEPVNDGMPGAGVYVAAGNHTYWYGDADPAKWSQGIGSHSGAVPGSSAVVAGTAVGRSDDAPVVIWLSRSGKLVVGAGGAVTEVQNRTVVDTADRAAPLVRERNGDIHYVAALLAPQKHALAVSDVAYAHVVHRDAP